MAKPGIDTLCAPSDCETTVTRALDAAAPGWRKASHDRVLHSLAGGTSMATLDEKKRDTLKGSQFGLPEERKYPMPDESHARNAKARAAQQEKKGNLTKAEEQKIDRKADKILDK